MIKTYFVMAFVILLIACQPNFETNNQLDTDMDIDKMTIMFYNAENLFDTINDPTTRDEEFLPKGKKNWNTKKYYTKLENLAKVIDELDKEDWPVIVGLGEVENRFVLEDLAEENQIVHAGYKVVHFNSPDERGIDMGMLYRKDYMNILEAENIGITFPFNLNIKTRDILYVKAGMINGETIHLFINHWPSRREGQMKTEAKRLHVAKVLRERIDELLEEDPNAKLIVMGDFNDYPTDESVADVLGAGIGDSDLFNMAYQLDKKGKGTVNHKGDWGMIDQIMVSKNFFEKEGWYIKGKDLILFYRDWLVYKDKKYGDFKPDKTFGGDKYYGGYSDHLPIAVQLKLKESK